MSDPNSDQMSGKPSQAEGEDPQRPSSGDEAAASGHPSQAEGEDAGRPAAGEEYDPDGLQGEGETGRTARD